MDPPLLVALAVLTAGVGTLGGLGGAVLLVPVLVLTGTEPALAAPLGLLSVAAGSLSAGSSQLAAGLVHHRLGITLEVAASMGAVAAAIVSDQVSGEVLQLVLAATAAVAAVAGLARKGVRNRPRPEFAADRLGEWPGTLGGAYLGPGGIVPYQARRLTPALVVMSAAGAVSGLSGVGGGFIKTPAMSEIMHVPVKVAAATSTFTVSITSASALLVFAAQGRIDVVEGAAVVLGGLVGGVIGARLQDHLPPTQVRRVLGVILVVVAVVLVVRR
ncbi:MAG TPA: TSUP family transporter [Acidimicrobiales bacterium]|nr:TSUP family transporter [Acidimicrobiales bacterium]